MNSSTVPSAVVIATTPYDAPRSSVISIPSDTVRPSAPVAARVTGIALITRTADPSGATGSTRVASGTTASSPPEAPVSRTNWPSSMVKFILLRAGLSAPL